MKQSFTCLSIVLLLSAACKNDPTGPEMGCDLNDLYVLDYHFIQAAKVFDLQTSPPTEIKNGALEYDLSQQAFTLLDVDPVPYPYSEYFIDSIQFVQQASAEVHIFESTNVRTYAFNREDCGIDLISQEGELHFELTDGGDEMAEQRFAIYGHSSRHVTIDSLSFVKDTFSFIEFRLGPFESYEDIILQFALEHPGTYDTVAIELVKNKTKE